MAKANQIIINPSINEDPKCKIIKGLEVLLQTGIDIHAQQ